MIAEIYDGRLNSKEKIDKNIKEKRYYRGDSLPYMAPEVISGEGWNNKADVWSLGCVLIEMLTGKVPWSDISTTFEEVLKIVKKSAYPSFPSGLSKDCEDFLRCCLSVNISKRSSLQNLLHHSFLAQYSKESDLFFEIPNNQSQVSTSRLKLQQNDKTNRAPSRTSRNESR
jgi:serine/threonine protein kinase